MTPEQFITAYSAALASQQWQQVAPLIHPNACVTFSTGAVHKGIDAIQKAYEHNFAIIKNEEYVVTDVHWVLTNSDSAVYLFNFNWKGIINGAHAEGSGKGTAVIVYEGAVWKLMAEHLGR